MSGGLGARPRQREGPGGGHGPGRARLGAGHGPARRGRRGDGVRVPGGQSAARTGRAGNVARGRGAVGGRLSQPDPCRPQGPCQEHGGDLLHRLPGGIPDAHHLYPYWDPPPHTQTLRALLCLPVTALTPALRSVGAGGRLQRLDRRLRSCQPVAAGAAPAHCATPDPRGDTFLPRDVRAVTSRPLLSGVFFVFSLRFLLFFPQAQGLQLTWGPRTFVLPSPGTRPPAFGAGLGEGALLAPLGLVPIPGASLLLASELGTRAGHVGDAFWQSCPRIKALVGPGRGCASLSLAPAWGRVGMAPWGL